MAEENNHYRFQGFASPTTTPVPDQLFDELLYHLSPTEIVVLLYIIRRTYGFKKDSDNISLNQMVNGIVTKDGRALDHGTGLSKATVARSLNSLEEKGVIERIRRRSTDRGDEPTTYRVREAAAVSQVETPRVSDERQAVSHQRDTQETVLQETERQDINPSNFRKVQTSKSKRSQTESQRVRPDRTGASVLGDDAEGGETPEQPALTWAPAPPDLSTSPDGPESPRTGVSSVGDILHRRTGKGASTSPPARQGRSQNDYPEERQRLLAYIQDFAIEFGDEAPLPSSVSRAYNLWHQSGIPIEAFTVLLYEARARTKEYAGSVKKTRSGNGGAFGAGKNRMPYFFGILEQALEQIQTKKPREILAEHERQRAEGQSSS